MKHKTPFHLPPVPLKLIGCHVCPFEFDAVQFQTFGPEQDTLRTAYPVFA